MPDAAPHPELLRSLGRLVRGLSALFWGLPLTLIVCSGTGVAEWFTGLDFFGFIPSMVVTGMVFFGLYEIGSFQRQERPWRAALDRARFFALLNFGLSPFLYWRSGVPQSSFFNIAVAVFAASSLLLLFTLNLVLLRLSAMLPDEALRHETRQATGLNRLLLLALLLVGCVWFFGTRFPPPFEIVSFRIPLQEAVIEIHGLWLVFIAGCVLALLPLSATMALIWKTKEVILDSVFHAR